MDQILDIYALVVNLLMVKETFSFYLQTSMLGMKRDCGGAAGILGAFKAAVKQV